MNYHILANLIHIFNTEKNSALYRNTLYYNNEKRVHSFRLLRKKLARVGIGAHFLVIFQNQWQHRVITSMCS